MESKGKPGYINISQYTKTLLETKYDAEFSFEPNPEAIVLNSGEKIESFFVYKLEDLP